ncbi:hypothetical protein DPMN_171978 [Dreissena polymorpha]|uniref:Uncharacterized protein n=1 Tax=Dreissena polymorpha TaxID=45954 RepID=A0A9D4DZY0_DREPO|nr:hypothetical protein DPMN_171978 [Dreissena polymorpha]
MEQCRACGCSLKKARSVASKLHGHGMNLTVGEGVKETFNVDLTPGRNVCGDCF